VIAAGGEDFAVDVQIQNRDRVPRRQKFWNEIRSNVAGAAGDQYVTEKPAHFTQRVLARVPLSTDDGP